MGILHPFPRHAFRAALLAAAVTILVMALLLLFPFDALKSGNAPAPSSAPAQSVPARPIVQRGPDWVVNPLAPVTIPGTRVPAGDPVL